jgi:hypothetical protein
MNILIKAYIYEVGQIEPYKNNRKLDFKIVYQETRQNNGKWEQIGEPVYIKCSIWNDKIDTLKNICIAKTNVIVAGKLTYQIKDTRLFFNLNIDMISELKNLKNIFADYKDLLKKYNNNEFADYVEVENDFDGEVPF